MNLQDVRLGFFLSRATPLKRWHEIGILEREIAIYNQLRPILDDLCMVTSGHRDELTYREQLPDIRILCNGWGLSPNFYSVLAPFLHRSTLQQATIYKTNQLDGSWTALIAGWLYTKPVVVRAGYPWSENFRKQKGDGFKARLINQIERFVLRRATHVVVTTEAIKKLFVEKHGLAAHKITVIPNYVDTKHFCPIPDIAKIKGQICFVGRLQTVKNVHVLLESLSHVSGTSLVVIGDGPERERLEKLAQQLKLEVQFKGIISNSEIPTEINRSEIFVLPSAFEGHPKALIEAMACGAAVIGAEVDGIRQIVRHEETGLLCAPTAKEIEAAIRRLLGCSDLQHRLGSAARAFALQEYSLERIVQMELSILQAIT